MKKIYLWCTAIVAVAIFCLIGCKKDKEQPFAGPGVAQPDSSKIYLPVKIIGRDFTTRYSYMGNSDTLFSVTKINSYSDTTSAISYISNQPQSFSYLVNGVAISLTEYTLSANGEVIRGDVYDAHTEAGAWDYYTPGALMSYYTLTYNSLNQLTQVSYFLPDGIKDHDEFFEYTTEGNISGTRSSGNLHLEYDNLNGIGKSVKNAHLFYIEGRDNLLFYTKNNPVKLNAASRTYKYNIDKYPVEMTVKRLYGTNVFKIEYRLK